MESPCERRTVKSEESDAMTNVASKSREQSVHNLVSSARVKQAQPQSAKNNDRRVCKDKWPLSNILDHNSLLFYVAIFILI